MPITIRKGDIEDLLQDESVKIKKVWVDEGVVDKE